MTDPDDLRAELSYVRGLSADERARFRVALDAADAGLTPFSFDVYVARLSSQERADFIDALDRFESAPRPVVAAGPDALATRIEAEFQAARLAPPEVAPQFLAEAIWLRALAFGAPTDAQVIEYLARCASDHSPVSGRTELEPGIAPVEVYSLPGSSMAITIELRRRGRSDYTATIIEHDGSRVPIGEAKSRVKAHRKIEARYPGGRWSSRLLSSEVAEIRRRWGLAETGDPR